MTFGRWYPTMAALPDGRVVTTSGLGADGFLSETPEIFDPATVTWSKLESPGPIPMFGHLVLLADGRLFYTGGQYGANNGLHPTIWNPATGAVTVVDGLADPETRNQSTSVLLPPAQDQRVMLIGGGGVDPHAPAMGTADTRIADLSRPAPVYEAGPAMAFPRMHVSAVILPDRSVLACGGSGMEEMGDHAAPHGELLDPGAAAWKPTAPQRVPRLYHSVALVIPDGRVVTAGSNPVRKTEELRIEIYWPPYLFQGGRPELRLSADTAGYGTTLTATTTGTLREASLMHPTSCTHSCDNNQRLVDLPFSVTGPGTVALTLPSNPALAPPGWYLVVVVDTRGVPSPGQWVHLS
jgi:hypothetical protein